MSSETQAAFGSSISVHDVISQMDDQLLRFQESFKIKELNAEKESAFNCSVPVVSPHLRNEVKILKPMHEIDLFLIGKTGNGKSAVGNSILGRNAFESKPSVCSVTREITYNMAEVNGYRIKVIDGPGVGDTKLDKEEDISAAIDVVSKAIALSPNGYHAFLLVVKFGQRFTFEEQAALKLLKTIFGETFFNRYCIIVMTCGDLFKTEVNVSFKDWILEQTSQEFRNMLEECGNRIVLFDNRTHDTSVKQIQLSMLLKWIEKLKSKNCRYSNEHFKSAKAARDFLLVDSGKEIISEKFMTEANLIYVNVQEIVKEKDPHQYSQSLQELSERATKLCYKITETDKGTGALHTLLNHVQSVASIIQTEITIAKKMVEESAAFEEKVRAEAMKHSKTLQRQKDEISKGFLDEKERDQKKIIELQEELKSMKEKEEKWQIELDAIERINRAKLELEQRKLTPLGVALEQIKTEQIQKVDKKVSQSLFSKIRNKFRH